MERIRLKCSDCNIILLDNLIYNTEGTIFRTTHNGKKCIYKFFRKPTAKYILDKEYVLSKLDENREYFPAELCLPTKFVFSSDNRLLGYLMDYIPGENLSVLLNSTEVDFQKKIEYLTKIGSLLEKLDAMRKITPLKRFFLNDLHESNFMINLQTGQLNAVDLDSSFIENSNVFSSKYLVGQNVLSYIKNKHYQKDDFDKIVPNENTDRFCYIIIILNFLAGINKNVAAFTLDKYENYIDYLENLGFDKDIIVSFRSIFTNEVLNPCSFLSNITPDLLEKASYKNFSLSNKRTI